MKESKFVRGLITAAAVIAVSAPAIASTGADNGLKGEAVKVSYADLNLQKEAGAKVLYRRLQQASRNCVPAEGPAKQHSRIRPSSQVDSSRHWSRSDKVPANEASRPPEPNRHEPE